MRQLTASGDSNGEEGAECIGAVRGVKGNGEEGWLPVSVGVVGVVGITVCMSFINAWSTSTKTVTSGTRDCIRVL